MGLQLAQQVNLFQSEFHVQSDFLCAKNLQNLLIAMLVILSLASIYDYIQEQNQTEYLAELRAQERKLEGALVQAKQTAPSMVMDAKLKQAVNDLKTDSSIKQQVLEALSGKSFGNTIGFSEIFKGLAQQNVPGLWLTNLNVRHGGKDIGITGSAFNPELVPDFLKKLSNEEIFHGTDFQTFRITREKNPIRVDFFIDTQFYDSSNE